MLASLLRDNPHHKAAGADRDAVAAGWSVHMCQLLDRGISTEQLEAEIDYATSERFLRTLVTSAKSFATHRDRIAAQRAADAQPKKTNGANRRPTFHDLVMSSIADDEANARENVVVDDRPDLRNPWDET